DGSNTATVSGGADASSGNNVSSDSYVVSGTPNLTLTKSHPADFIEGQQGTYTIVVRNAGTAPTSGEIVVQDPIPDAMTPTGATGSGWSCTIQGQTVTCRRSDILQTGTSAPPIAITVNALRAATVTNVATVSGGGDQSPGDNTAPDPTVIGGRPR